MPAPDSLSVKRETLIYASGLLNESLSIAQQRPNRTDFVLDAARAAAEDALIEQRVMLVDPDSWQAFITRLDQPPAPNAELRRTMQTPAPWDAKK